MSTYKNAGVDIDAGNELVKRIKPLAESTQKDRPVGEFGGFGSMFEIPEGYNRPILISGTDGVGTKLALANDMSKHDTIGIDLVAMCVNDIITTGADPLFFLDYFATGHLKLDTAEAVIKGITNGCIQAGAALVGGETAEMPGMYRKGEYDLAGFCVGVVEFDDIINGRHVKVGDKLIGLASSGPHSNGYSLIRKILSQNNVSTFEQINDKYICDLLLEPTIIYVQAIQSILRHHEIYAMSHITGGGLTENVPRMFHKDRPDAIKADIDYDAWQRPEIFNWLQEEGDIDELEMRRTFNCGIGMVICVKEESEDAVHQILHDIGQPAYTIGDVIPQ